MLADHAFYLLPYFCTQSKGIRSHVPGTYGYGALSITRWHVARRMCPCIVRNDDGEIPYEFPKVIDVPNQFD